jgi:hypothetical protein
MTAIFVSNCIADHRPAAAGARTAVRAHDMRPTLSHAAGERRGSGAAAERHPRRELPSPSMTDEPVDPQPADELSPVEWRRRVVALAAAVRREDRPESRGRPGARGATGSYAATRNRRSRAKRALVSTVFPTSRTTRRGIDLPLD